ncbi:MAG: hypothetical protein R2699_02670 [Acidimicrobiales bacterium]
MLTDGKYHDVDSSEMAFKIAGTMVFARRPARPPDLLEPIMKVEVVTPRSTWVTSWATCRRAAARSAGWNNGNSQVVGAQVPLGDVRLRYRPAFQDPRRHLHHAVRLVPADACLRAGRDRHPH